VARAGLSHEHREPLELSPHVSIVAQGRRSVICKTLGDEIEKQSVKNGTYVKTKKRCIRTPTGIDFKKHH